MARAGRRSRSVVTISDVAHRAGVSPMTVSRVINDGPNVRTSTREAVNRAIRELNYAPNIAARSLAKADDVRLGVIYSNPSAAFLSEFLLGVLDETQGQGAPVALVRCEDGEAAEVEAVQRLVGGGSVGVVLTPPHSESDVMRQALSEAGVAAATVAASRPTPGMICVRIDDRRAAYDMGRHLLQLGHRRIGLIGGAPNQSSSPERRLGLEQATAEAPGAEIVFAQGRFDYASGLEAAEVLLGAPDPPTAIFALNDDMAAAVVSVAHRRGLDVPRDVSVVGFDDMPTALTLWPPLTTIRQPVREMAAYAVRLLIQKLRGREEDADATDRVLPYAMVERQSTAPPLSDAGRGSKAAKPGRPRAVP